MAWKEGGGPFRWVVAVAGGCIGGGGGVGANRDKRRGDRRPPAGYSVARPDPEIRRVIANCERPRAYHHRTRGGGKVDTQTWRVVSSGDRVYLTRRCSSYVVGGGPGDLALVPKVRGESPSNHREMSLLGGKRINYRNLGADCGWCCSHANTCVARRLRIGIYESRVRISFCDGPTNLAISRLWADGGGSGVRRSPDYCTATWRRADTPTIYAPP